MAANTSRKIGLTSRRLAPPPAIVSIDTVSQRHGYDTGRDNSDSQLTTGPPRESVDDNLRQPTELEGSLGSYMARQQSSLAVTSRCPVPRSVATCVSKRQRLQAEFHDKTKKQTADFFAQRSLEADRLPTDQARHFSLCRSNKSGVVFPHTNKLVPLREAGCWNFVADR